MRVNSIPRPDELLLERWEKFIRRSMGAQAAEDILAALQDFLSAGGEGAPRCEFRTRTTDDPADDTRWSFSVDEDHVLVIDPGIVGAEEDVGLWYLAATLARARLRHLLESGQRWGGFMDALDRIGTAASETAVLRELAMALAHLFDIAHTRVLRYRADVDGLSLEASYDTTSPFPLSPGLVLPLSALPAHREALEHGCAVYANVDIEPSLRDECSLLFPPETSRVLIVPFWLSTRDMGLVSLAEWAGERPDASPWLSALLHHTALAVERVRLLEDVEAARAESDLILGKTIIGVLLLSEDLRILRANPAAAALWDTDVEDLLGRAAADLFGNEIRDLFESRWNGRGRRVGDIVREWEITTVRGESRHVSMAVSALPAHAGGRAAYLVSLMDITEQKRVARLRKNMIGNVTHEMRTPIAVIRGYAELLQEQGEGADPAFREQALAIIQQRANDLLHMVDLYLDLSGLESEEMALNPELVGLEGLVGAIWRERTATRAQAPTLQVDVAPEARHVRVDVHLFGQVMRHLLDNAIKFTPAEGHVRVRAWSEGKDLHVVVEDTGEGIAPEDLPHIFDAFYRGQNAGFGVAGSGLGLALVRAGVRRMGGHVTVTSKPGEGSVFHVVLPGVVASAPETIRNLPPAET